MKHTTPTVPPVGTPVRVLDAEVGLYQTYLETALRLRHEPPVEWPRSHDLLARWPVPTDPVDDEIRSLDDWLRLYGLPAICDARVARALVITGPVYRYMLVDLSTQRVVAYHRYKDELLAYAQDVGYSDTAIAPYDPALVARDHAREAGVAHGVEVWE